MHEVNITNESTVGEVTDALDHIIHGELNVTDVEQRRVLFLLAHDLNKAVAFLLKASVQRLSEDEQAKLNELAADADVLQLRNALKAMIAMGELPVQIAYGVLAAPYDEVYHRLLADLPSASSPDAKSQEDSLNELISQLRASGADVQLVAFGKEAQVPTRG